MISTHVYSARVMPADVDLGTVAGSITLDASGIPHVTADLSFSVPDAALLDLLDPRDGARLEVTASRDGGAARVFDLGIREVNPDRGAGTVAVKLASDEAILGDVAPLADDKTPRAHQSSLRAVCNYVLGKIGAHLEPGPLDANVTAFWPVSNLLPNPGFEINLTGWSTWHASSFVRTNVATPVTGNWAAQWVSDYTGVTAIESVPIRVTPGKPVTFAAYMLSNGTRPARLMIRHRAADGRILAEHRTPNTTLKTTSWTRLALVGKLVPPGAATATVHAECDADGAGRQVFIDSAIFYEGDELIPYFDGEQPPSAGYTYAWSDPANVSTSSRIPDIERPPEVLTWHAGTSGMDFLQVLLKQAGLRLVCDELRRWWLRDDASRADGGQTWRYGANIIAADEQLSLDEYYGSAVYEYVWTDADGIPQRRIDSFALVPAPAPVLHVQVNAPYPGPGRAEALVRRAQGRGRMVTVTGIPDWTERTDQPLSVLLDGTPIQTGISGTVVYSLDDDTVTVTSRTTDTPAAAWILIPVGARWIDSPAGESWTEEIIHA